VVIVPRPAAVSRFLKGDPRCLGLALLGVAVGQDRRAILRPVVAALAHPLCRVVLFPEELEQLAV